MGETKRALKVRTGEHEKQSIIVSKDTPFFKHIFNFGHSFDIDNAKILDIESHYFCRLTSEMVHINIQNNGINIQKDLKKSMIECNSNFQFSAFFIISESLAILIKSWLDVSMSLNFTKCTAD